MAYIDVREVYPIFVSDQFAHSLEDMIRDNHIPVADWRSITVNQAIEYLVGKGLVVNVVPNFRIYSE